MDGPYQEKNEDAETSDLKSREEVELGDVVKSNGRRTTNGHINHEFLDYEPSGWLETTLTRVGSSTDDFFKENSSAVKTITVFALNGVVIGYFLGCLYYYLSFNTEPLELCQGFGSLIAFLSIVYFFIIYFFIVKPLLGALFEEVVWRRVEVCRRFLWRLVWFRLFSYVVIIASIVSFLYFDTQGAPERLISLIGLAVLLLLGFIFSKHPGRVNWRSVLSGLLLQFLFGLLFIRWDFGRMALQCFSDKVATFLSYGVDGAAFAFGDLLVRTEGVFAFSTLPVIFFFSMLVEVLFFWGALQWVCLKLGELLRAATNTTVCESVIAIGNVFLGMSESILLVKPYLPQLTPSELHVVMSSGFATVSGTILASYIGFGASPAHLVTASVMSAPAAICYSKLLMPETRRSLTTVDNIQTVISEDQSALSAATRGATNGISLILNIIANIVAFVAFIAFINGVFSYCGGMLGHPELNLEWIMGKVFIPLSWIMGVPWEECELVGSLIGLKTVVNEFVAYQRMGEMKLAGLLSPRAELIATYALCGFTNPGSAGIMIGAIAAMAPNQRETLSSLAFRAFFAGCGICFMTACIAELTQDYLFQVATFLSYGVDGAAFAFGDLLVRTEGVFAFSTLPVIFFFSMLVEVLFFWGALQWVCLKLGELLRAATNTTVCESVIAIGNVFLGMSESILLVKPYLPQLTPSELHVVMSSGFATVSGTILASYIGFGASPAHLVTASVMSAPAAICYSKLLMPETRRSLTTVDNIQTVISEDQSALSAATRGATNGISLILNIIANIVAFVAFIAFINGVFSYCGGMLGHPELNLEWIMGKVFIPLSWIMGVPWEECELVGSLIGLKTVVNEFVAYQRMGEMKLAGLLSPRAELIATYALCGFTNPGSAGIMIGAIAAMAPNQRETLSSLAFRAFFAGCGICFMTACIAGILMPEGAFG